MPVVVDVLLAVVVPREVGGDAVRLEDGRTVMEKQAILMDVPFTVDGETRRRFDAEVGRLVERVTMEGDVSAWRDLMPEDGIVPFSRM